jgi:hypothetical protein
LEFAAVEHPKTGESPIVPALVAIIERDNPSSVSSVKTCPQARVMVRVLGLSVMTRASVVCMIMSTIWSRCSGVAHVWHTWSAHGSPQTAHQRSSGLDGILGAPEGQG